MNKVIDILQALGTYSVNSTSSNGAQQPVGPAKGTGGRPSSSSPAPTPATFADLMIDEVVKSIDALSRSQILALLNALGLRNAFVPGPRAGR